MKKVDYVMQKKPITLTENEKIMESDIHKLGGSSVRNMIWAYVEEDKPIPNELKSSLLEILQKDFKNKSKEATSAKWDILVKEVVYLTLGISMADNGDIDIDEAAAMTRDDAIEHVANDYDGVNFGGLERVYNSSKYRWLKDMINEWHIGVQNK